VSLVLYEVADHVATITLNRPEAMNALSRALLAELRDAIETFRGDESRVAIVTGAGGRAFSAGADLKEMAGGGSTPEPRAQGPSRGPLASLLERPAGFIFGGTELYKPLVAAIDGYCLAGGLELALACDIRIASNTSRFGLTEVTRGIMPGFGGTQRLPRTVPLPVAMEILLTGRHCTAQEAERWGLVNRVVEPEQTLPAAREVAAAIAANAPLAVRATKEAVMRGQAMHLEDGLRFESYLMHSIFQTEDAREGPRAFAERRKPSWKGR
jgi:enoyl-CoA hydratase/carnithine racemase